MGCNKIITYILFLFFIVALSSCLNGRKGDDSGIKDKKTFHQYMVLGEKLYKTNCGNCHQDDGSGLRRLYPPLNNSDFLEKDKSEILCVIRYGKKGNLLVNGITFDQEMPVNDELTALDISAISTYVLSTFGKKSVLVTQDDIRNLNGKCKGN